MSVTKHQHIPTKPTDKFVARNTSLLKRTFNLEVTKINKKLLYIYWTPKLQRKNPSDARFIIALSKCSAAL